MKKAIKQSTLTSALNIGAVIAIIFGVVACVGVLMVSSKMNTATSNRFDLVNNANRFSNASAYLTNQVRSYAVTTDEKHYNNYWNEVNTLKNRDDAVANMQTIGLTTEEQAMLDEMAAISNNLVPLESQSMDYTKAFKRELAISTVFSDEYGVQLDKISTLQTGLLNSLETRTAARVDDLSRQSIIMWIICGTMIFLVVVSQVVSFFVIKRKIILPITKVKDEMLEISRGNLSTQLSLTPDTSEIGMLVYAIGETKKTLQSYIGDISEKLSDMAANDMTVEVDMDYQGDFAPIKSAMVSIVASLNDTLSQINIAANQVASGSNQVSMGAQSLAQGATEQASSIEELSATIAEISEHVRENATRASGASKKGDQTGDEIDRSNSRMNDLMKAIEDIRIKSSEIGTIVKTIDDIAFQTNILALNAAVEAARAGVAGKGFAVVADEVRNLAGKSSTAAKNTTALITDSIKAVERGAKLANDTSAAMAGVVPMAKEVVGTIDQIAEASNSQSNSITQVTIGVDQISAVIQTNSATSEQSAAASEQLNVQAQRLKTLVGRFKLKERTMSTRY